jgi:hypothetical protein
MNTPPAVGPLVLEEEGRGEQGDQTKSSAYNQDVYVQVVGVRAVLSPAVRVGRKASLELLGMRAVHGVKTLFWSGDCVLDVYGVGGHDYDKTFRPLYTRDMPLPVPPVSTVLRIPYGRLACHGMTW